MTIKNKTCDMTYSIKTLTGEELWDKYTENKWRIVGINEKCEILFEVYFKALSKFYNGEVVNFIYGYYSEYKNKLEKLQDEIEEMEIELEERGVWCD